MEEFHFVRSVIEKSGRSGPQKTFVGQLKETDWGGSDLPYCTITALLPKPAGESHNHPKSVILWEFSTTIGQLLPVDGTEARQSVKNTITKRITRQKCVEDASYSRRKSFSTRLNRGTTICFERILITGFGNRYTLVFTSATLRGGNQRGNQRELVTLRILYMDMALVKRERWWSRWCRYRVRGCKSGCGWSALSSLRILASWRVIDVALPAFRGVGAGRARALSAHPHSIHPTYRRPAAPSPRRASVSPPPPSYNNNNMRRNLWRVYDVIIYDGDASRIVGLRGGGGAGSRGDGGRVWGRWRRVGGGALSRRRVRRSRGRRGWGWERRGAKMGGKAGEEGKEDGRLRLLLLYLPFFGCRGGSYFVVGTKQADWKGMSGNLFDSGVGLGSFDLELFDTSACLGLKSWGREGRPVVVGVPTLHPLLAMKMYARSIRAWVIP
ncbi:hypothetical protein C8R46DRAFT_1326024 [Mycena filopes]|nr:hypothetical protein C8R46DRAFT_1326024 [Mycena filopes]